MRTPTESAPTGITAYQHPAPARGVTQADIARRCGLHQTTVSLALRSDPRVSEQTIAAVMAVATEIGYDPQLNSTARRLAQRRFGHETINNAIALSVHPSFIHFHYNAAIFSGVVDTLIPGGFALTLVNLPGRYFEKEDAPLSSLFIRGDIDGLIIDTPPTAFVHTLERLRNAPGFAHRAIVGLLYQHEEFSSVVTDDRQGAYLSACHLLELGHCHLLQLCSTTEERAAGLPAQRWAGVRQALTERGLDPARYLHFCVVSTEWMNPLWLPSAIDAPPAGGQALLRTIAEQPEITAILGMNDACAQQAWQVLTQAGYGVPEQFSIVGFDDVDPKFDHLGNNMLTSVHLPLVELGQTAAELIIDHVTGRRTKKQEVVLPAELIVRSSTTDPRSR